MASTYFYRPAGNRAFHLDWRRAGDASVELAGAVGLWMAANYFLAGGWTAGPLPNPGRRPWRAGLSSLRRPASNKRAHGRTLGKNDAGGAREVPQQLARTLRRLRSTPQRI